MHKRSLRIEVDDKTYNILKEQQRLYYDAKTRKISFANVIMHYFFQGIENSNSKIENGLSVIKIPLLDSQSINKTPNEVHESSRTFQFTLNDIKQREEHIEHRERQLWQKENSLARKSLELSRSAIEVNQESLIELRNQSIINSKSNLTEIKNELIYLIKNNRTSDKLDMEFRQISKKLDKIDSQTKKSTMDLILRFASPLISIVGFLLINKKLNASTPEVEPILQEIKNIYSKLDEKEKGMISEKFSIDLDSIL